MPNPINQFRGLLELTFLGRQYTLMKPSYDAHVYVLFQPPPPQERQIDLQKLETAGDQDHFEVKDMLNELLRDKLKGSETKPKFTDWLESAEVMSLILVIHEGQLLLRAGLSLILKDEGEHRGQGFDNWFRVKKIQAEFSRDYRDRVIPGALKAALYDYLDDTREEIRFRVQAITMAQINNKLKEIKPLSSQELEALNDTMQQASGGLQIEGLAKAVSQTKGSPQVQSSQGQAPPKKEPAHLESEELERQHQVGSYLKLAQGDKVLVQA